MPAETETSIHRALAELDLHSPFTRAQVLERAGNEIIRAGGKRFVLKSALGVVPEETFFDSHDLVDALNARWDELQRMLF